MTLAEKHKQYDENPNYCNFIGCNKPLDWDHRNNKYCCIECANMASALKAHPNNYDLIKIGDKIIVNKKESICLYCGSKISYNKKFCNTSCEHSYKEDESYKDFLENNDMYCKPNYVPRLGIRKHILQEQNGVCAIDGCNCTPFWNGKELHFVLDHIDGDASNNKRNNLRLVCPNCDSQLDTFKSKNKNSTRRNYWKENILKQINLVSC